MATAAFQAGTVFVDVVPSMKGFYKDVSSQATTDLGRAGKDAAGAFTKSFSDAAKTNGSQVADALTAPLTKSIPRLKAEAAQAAQALKQAQAAADSTGGALSAARNKEAAAAENLERAERALAEARKSGSPRAMIAAEEAYKRALEGSKAANAKADKAAEAHSRALGEVKAKSSAAESATEELSAAMRAEGQAAQQTEKGLRGWISRLRESRDASAEAEAGVDRSTQSFSSMHSFLAGAAAPALGFAAALGIGGVAGEAITASDAVEKFKSTLQFAGLGKDTIDALTASTRAYADATVYELADIQSITAQLAANGVENYDKLAEAAGNLNAVAGGNADTFKSVGMVLTQTAGQGKLTTENWNQLSDAIPGAAGKLQKALLDAGAFTGNFREAMEKGQISAEEFNAAILTLGSDETAQAAARSTSTLEGAAGNLQATLVGAVNDLISWLKPTLTEAMGWMSDSLQGGFDWIKENKDVVLALATGVATATAAYAGFSILTSVKTWITSTTLATKGLNAAMKANVIGIIVTAIAALVAGFILLYKKNEGFREKVNELGRAVKNVWENQIYPAISAVWEWISGTLIPGFKGIWDILFNGDFTGPIFGLEEDSGLVDFLFTLRDAAMTAWDFISNTLVPGIKGVWDILFNGEFTGPIFGLEEDSGLVDFLFTLREGAIAAGNAISTAWNTVIWPALQGLWSFVTGTLIPAIQNLWYGVIQPAFSAIGTIISTAWNSVIWPALQGLWSFITNVLAPNISWFWTTVVQPVFSAIGSFISSAWTNIIWPALQAFWSFITNVLAPIITWLWSNIVSPAFSAIGTIISTAWNYVIWPSLQALWAFITNVLAPVFTWLWNNVIKPIWQGISTTITTVVDFLTGTVFPKISTVLNTLKTGFDTFKTGVQTAFNAIKSAAAKPINFVINTIYRDGIKKAFDTIAEKIGLDTRLPTVNGIPGYAQGGQWRTMTPGYTPGRDVFTFFSPDGGGALRLSGGEGIIRPDALRALGGKPWLDAVNDSRGKGLSTVGDTGPHRGTVAFAEGGIWSRASRWVKNKASAAVNWVKDTASAVGDIISDPVGAFINLIMSPAQELLDSMGSSAWVQMAKALPGLWWESLKSLFVNETKTVGATDLVSAARKAIGVPYVWGGSAIPPGLDCSGLVYWSAQQLGLNWPRLTAAGYQAGSTPISAGQAVPGDLLFWGNPAHHVAIYSGSGMMVEEPHEGAVGRETAIWGSPTYGRYKYDQGGILPPGARDVVNLTRRPEAILTARQWDDVSTLASRGGIDLDGLEVRLVINDETSFDAHIEGLTAGVLNRRARLVGRSR